MEGFTEHKTSVQEFLRRLSTASYRLSIFNNKINKNNHDTVMVDEESNRMDQEDATDHLDLIARHLLTACDIRVLSSGTLNLPPFNYSKEKLWDDTEKDDDDDNHDDAKIPKPYQHKRSDYLRKLLRVMAPVSMQIAANICSLSSSKEERKQSQAAVVLFSHWLPVAPHLTPMVTEYFRSCDDPWKQSIAEGQDSIKDLSCQAEACYNLTLFYSKRGDIYSIRNLWDWKFLFVMLQPRDIAMGDDENDSSTDGTGEDEKAIRWFAARILGRLLDWKPDVILSTLQRLGLEDNRVPWLVHPWEVNQEEADMQNSVFRSRVSLWGSDEFDLPSAEQVQQVLPSNNFLANLGPGLIFYKYSSLTKASSKIGETSGAQKHLILTPTTCRNLALLGSVLCEEPNPPPILICGPHGSGKSSLIRELLRLCRPEEDSLLEFHIDEETDSKTLIGSYTTTDIPGEFAWRAGALTHATREGQWVLIEDVDSVPVEIQATLTKLLEDRMLPLGNGKYERCHPNFRIFGTCTTTPHYEQQRQSLRVSAHRGGGKRILCPSLWRNVHVKPLPFSELKQVASSLFTNLPESVIDTSLSLLQTLDRSGRDEVVPTQASSSGDGMNDEFSGSNILDVRDVRLWTGGRNPSVRDFFKLLSRISNGVCFESNVAFTTEAQRTLCLAECVDIFVGSCPNRQLKTEFVNFVAAPIWSISRDLAISYVETRRPPTLVGADVVEIGRAKIHLGNHIELSQRSTSQTFAQTNHALRLMEALGICIRENEPALLVGETGCGKTTLVQQLAVNCERELIVQNLSLQTDSTDLLGGYKPLEIQNVARKVYNEFVDLFVATFSRKQNAKFLQYAASMLEKANWKKLSRCFQRASQLGQSKMKEKVKDTALVSSKKRITLSRSWNKFSETTERFERQRVSCDAGLAFVFSEGVLVDAIHSGKW
jgi:midasin